MKYKLPVAKRELQKIEYVSGVSRGRAQGAGLLLIFRPNWGPKGWKKFCFETVSPPPPPTLSPGLHEGPDPPLYVKRLGFLRLVWFFSSFVSHYKIRCIPSIEDQR